MNKRLLSTLLALFLALALLPGKARAADVAFGSCGDNATWALSDNGTLTISGSGPMWNYSYAYNAPWYLRRNEVKSIVVSGTVSTIGQRAFASEQYNSSDSGYCNLASVTISASVTSIGYQAFYQYAGATNINLKSIYYGGTEAQWGKITIDYSNNNYLFNPQSRTYYSGSPNTSTIAAGRCGDNATWALSNSGTLTINGSGSMWDFNYAYNAPWYRRRSEVKSIVVSGTVSAIGQRAFASEQYNSSDSGYCNLTSATISASVTSIGYQAFYQYAGATNINLKSIYYGGTEAQWGKITIDYSNNNYLFNPQSRTYYSGSPNTSTIAAGQCGDNVTWALSDSGTLTIHGSGAMWNFNYAYNAPWYRRRNDVKSVVVSGTVSAIGQRAFASEQYNSSDSGYCNLTSVTIPVSVTSIGYQSFYQYNGAKYINLKDIYYAGTASQWGQINVDKSNNNFLYTTQCQMHPNSVPPATKYTVTFDPNGGTVSKKSMTIINGAVYGSLPVPTRPGYIFSGWYTESVNGTAIFESTTFWETSDQTLYAHWTGGATTPTTMTVTFNPNSGTVTTKSKSVTNGSTYGTLPTPTRTGYKFDGWYTASTGGTQVTAATKVTKTTNHTLYAHWTKNTTTSKTMTVTFNASSGTTPTKSKTVTNGSTYGTLPTPTRTGYKFDGWYTSSTGGTKVTSATKVTKTAAHTLYAHWSKTRTFSVTLDANGGTAATEYLAVNTGMRYRHLPTPTRSGYHFEGWYTKAVGGTKVTESTQVTNSVTTLYAHWTTKAPTVKNTQTKTCQIVIPSDYQVLLHSSTTTAAVAKTAIAQTSEYVVTCTKRVELSNGTVRYYGIFPKVSKTASYWFTYSDEMFIN